MRQTTDLRNRTRLEWVDYMKAFGIMAVVLYHTALPHSAKTLVYLFTLPAFFFTAGMFADSSLSPMEFFRRKTCRLLIPYLIFGILSWGAWVIVARRYGADSDTALAWWQPLWGMVVGTSDKLIQNAPLWFLPAFVCLEWLWYFINRNCLSKVWQIAVVILVAVIGIILGKYHIVLPWGLTAAFIMLPVYWLGNVLAGYLKRSSQAVPVWVWSIVLIIAAGGIAIGYVYNPDIKISVAKTGNVFLFYLTTLNVIAFILSLAIIVSKIRFALQLAYHSPMNYIGTITLWILCLHLPFFGFVKGVALICGVQLSFFETNLGCATLWATTFLILVPLIYLGKYILATIRKNRYIHSV